MQIFIFLVWSFFIFLSGFYISKYLKINLLKHPSKPQNSIPLKNPSGYDEELFKINNERRSAWVKASIAWMSNPQKVSTAFYHIQLLGIVDARIYSRNINDYMNKEGKWICDSNGVMLRERDMILADLWLLGVYEFIRAVDQRYRNKSGPQIDEAKNTIHQTKELFRRVRIPLAKNETAKGFDKSDDIAAPIGCGNNGFGWQINKNTTISQRVLSDSFLNMLRTVKPGWLMTEEEREKYSYEDEQGKKMRETSDNSQVPSDGI